MDGEELKKTRAQTKADKNGDAQPNQNGKHDETNGKVAEADSTGNGAETVAKEETAEDEEDKAAMKRTRTMEETVKVCDRNIVLCVDLQTLKTFVTKTSFEWRFY